MKKDTILLILVSFFICINIVLTIFLIKTNKKIDNLQKEFNVIKEEYGFEMPEEFYDGGTYDESLDIVYDDEIYVDDNE